MRKQYTPTFYIFLQVNNFSCKKKSKAIPVTGREGP
jgi:hypothetical protein